MSENREPTEKQKAAAYDKFMAYLYKEPGPLLALEERYYASLLKNFAMEAPVEDERK